MRQSFKVLVNTGALYLKIVVNAMVTLISTRIALKALGIDSYGLYNLIAGVIALLAFFNGALMVSSQRFLSIAIGEKDDEKLLNIFKISFVVHLFLGLIVAVFFKALQPFLFNGFLNIEPEMTGTAKRVFDIMIITSFVTIFIIPYNAAINAREELWFFSISEVIVSVLKLGAAVYLLYASTNLLLTYTVLMLFAIVLGGLIKYLWCIFRYPECRIKRGGGLDKKLFKEIFNFAGWNTLGSLSMVLRSQGIAVILNLFFGTVLNAAYGVANQLNALVITFAGTLTMVFTPMIVKAKGESSNDKMLFISIFASKMTFFLSSVIALPVLIFTSLILRLWLEVVPQYTTEFCQVIISSFLVMQIYPGITRALYAEGNIKWYQIVISILLAATLPVGYLLFSLGFPPVSIFFVLVIAQIFTLVATIYFAGKKVNLNVKKFYKSSVFTPCLLFIGTLICALLTKNLLNIFNDNVDFIIIIISIIVYTILYYRLIFTSEEAKLLNNVYNSLKAKMIKNDKKCS